MGSLLTARPRIASPPLAAQNGLTGLPGRSALLGWLRLGGVGDTPGGTTALMVLHLDQFRTIANRFGPETAETALLHIVARIRGAVPDKAGIARLAVEEVAIVLPETSPNQAASLAGRLVTACAAPSAPGLRLRPR